MFITILIFFLLLGSQAGESFSWSSLGERIQSQVRPTDSDRNIIFYRDTNGWCPFCERAWLALEHSSVSYQTELINLQNKQAWYKEMVPTALVPALKFVPKPEELETIKSSEKYFNCTKVNDKGEVIVWESKACLHVIDEFFKKDTSSSFFDKDSELFERATKLSENLQSAGFSFTYSTAQTTPEEKANRRSGFENSLDQLDKFLASHGGPFMAGSRFTAVDMMCVPSLERFRFQLPYSKKFNIYDQEKYPALKKWFDNMDEMPCYRRRVRGDAISWLSAVSVFSRIFSPKDENGNVAEDVLETIKYADASLESFLDFAKEDTYNDEMARLDAARVIIQNHEAIVNDICNQDPKSQTHLSRLSEDKKPLIDEALQFVCNKLIQGNSDAIEGTGSENDLNWSPEQYSAVRKGLNYLAHRVCVPRDMGCDAARVLRTSLLNV